MASEVGSAYVSILPSAAGFASRLQREIGSDLARAGKKGGQEYGKAFEKEAVDQADTAASGMSDKLKVGLAAGGALAGAALIAGVGEALDRGRLEDKLAAQLGGGAKTRRATKVAADLFNGAWGESVEDVNNAVASVVTNVGGMRKATQRELKGVTASVLDIATAFDQDASAITRAADQLVRTNLAKGPREALDIITKGFQAGANEADDLLDTYAEYGTQFRKLGLDGKEATGLLTQGLKAGARDADVVADAFKEFSIRAVDGSELTKDSFDALGLSAADMEDKIGRGGKSAADATDLVLDRLRKVKDPADRAQIAVGLFGTQSEDLGDALYALDPSNAVDTLGKVGGAAKRMGKTLNDNAASQLESFKRTMQSKFVNFLGNEVIPAAQDLWEDVGPDVKKLGGALGDMAEDVGPAVKDTLPIVAGVVGDVAGAFGKFARAFSSLPKPLQTAIITAALAGYGVKKLRGVGAGFVGAGGSGLPLILGGGGRAAATGTVAAGATTATAGRMSGVRSLGRSFWPYLLADAGYEALVGDLWGTVPSQHKPRNTGAFGVGAATPGQPLTPTDTQTAAELSGARFNALHDLGDLLKIGTRVGPEWLGLGNAFGDLDKHLANIADKNPGKAFKILQRTAADANVPIGMLTSELPDTAKALDDSGIAAKIHAARVRGAREAGWDLLGLWRKNLLPTAKTLADRFDLDTDEAGKLRQVLSDTTGTAKQHEKQLRQVARQMGLNKQETQELINKYGDIPQKVETRAEFLTAEAERKRDSFLTQTKGKFSDLGNETYAIMVNGQSGHGRIFAAGGFVSGPGGPRDDKISARLSNGEFVVNADATRQNRELLESINAKKFADGGIVGRTNTKVNMNLSALRQVVAETLKALQTSAASGGMTSAQVARGLAFARSQVGDPYVWGGVGPNGYDCSGFQSAVFNAARGLNPYHRLGSTGTMPWPHMAPGKGGAYQIGWFTGNPGHTAGTLGGVNIESRGGEGVVVGRNARGADDPLFNRHAHFTTAAGRNIPVSVGRGDPAFTGATGSPNRLERWIIGRESGGRVTANNPTSSAFGLGQLISSNRVAYAKRLGLNWHREMGDTGTTDYGAQLAMMRMYMKDRYGGARGAVNFWQQHGYYDNGGVLKPGYTMAYNGTGRDEYVTKEPPRRRGPQRIVLDAGSIGRLSGWIDDRIDGALDFEATTGRMR